VSNNTGEIQEQTAVKNTQTANENSFIVDSDTQTPSPSKITQVSYHEYQDEDDTLDYIPAKTSV
jgi:hypothetical protein